MTMALDPESRARSTDPTTSVDAARRMVAKDGIRKSHARILAFMKEKGEPISANDAVDVLLGELSYSRITTAFSEMKAAGLIELHGEKRNRYGNKERAWRVKK